MNSHIDALGIESSGQVGLDGDMFEHDWVNNPTREEMMPSRKELRGGLTAEEYLKPLPENHRVFRGGYVVSGTYTIQGLNLKLTQELDAKQTVIDRLEAENKLQDERFASLEQRLLAMEASMN